MGDGYSGRELVPGVSDGPVPDVPSLPRQTPWIVTRTPLAKNHLGSAVLVDASLSCVNYVDVLDETLWDF